MDNFNKLISFFLGLVVVVVFFAVITGRIDLKNKIPLIAKKNSISPTPTTKLIPTPISSIKIENNTQYSRYQTTTKSIPATGSPTEVLFLIPVFSTLGFFLKSAKPRNF